MVKNYKISSSRLARKAETSPKNGSEGDAIFDPRELINKTAPTGSHFAEVPPPTFPPRAYIYKPYHLISC